VVASATAFGGGTVRDLVMDKHPVYWIDHWEYPIIILALTAIFYFISRLPISNSFLIVSDALGLSLFTISTTQTLLNDGTTPIIAILLSVITATFGGLIRDVLCNEVPMIFQKVRLYASMSFFGSVLYWLLSFTPLISPVSMGTSGENRQRSTTPRAAEAPSVPPPPPPENLDVVLRSHIGLSTEPAPVDEFNLLAREMLTDDLAASHSRLLGVGLDAAGNPVELRFGPRSESPTHVTEDPDHTLFLRGFPARDVQFPCNVSLFDLFSN